MVLMQGRILASQLLPGLVITQQAKVGLWCPAPCSYSSALMVVPFHCVCLGFNWFMLGHGPHPRPLQVSEQVVKVLLVVCLRYF